VFIATMTYVLKNEIPSVADYIAIRLAAGLSRKSKEAARIGLARSLFGVVVYHDAEPIGIGRVIGDGGCFFEVTDIAVLPAHQKKGVGDLIMKAIMEYLHTHAPKTAYVSLMADHGTPHFYKRYGFSFAEMPKASGMFLRIT
jgi:GNAT superfamily N-acetyltransferase